MLLVLGLAASTLIMAKPAFAQVPTPSVPQFTVYLIDNSYDVPPTSPTYTTNPYTGAQQLVSSGSPGYHVQSFSIQLWIFSQHLSYSNGSTTLSTYYSVRAKGHFSQDWTISSVNNNESNSKYTVLSMSADDYPTGGQVDFQVQAILGYFATTWVWDLPGFYIPPQTLYVGDPAFGSYQTNFVTEAASDWSSTQTITIGDNTNPIATPSQSQPTPTASALHAENPTATPTQSGAHATVPQLDVELDSDCRSSCSSSRDCPAGHCYNPQP